jgi:hypothetical protein
LSTITWVAITLAAAAFIYGFFGHLLRRASGRRRGTMYEVIRETAFVGFQRRRGLDAEHAAWATLALHPLDNDHRPIERQLEGWLRKRSRDFARASKVANNDELRELTIVTLRDYTNSAADAGDAYYKTLFEWAAIEAHARLPEDPDWDAPAVSSLTFRQYLQRRNTEGRGAMRRPQSHR